MNNQVNNFGEAAVSIKRAEKKTAINKLYLASDSLKNQYHVAIILSTYHEDLASGLREGVLSRFREYGFTESQLDIFEVPGAFEIPLIANLIAKKNHYACIIALGAVIRGETSHYDYVCQQVSQGCQYVSLNQDIPVIFGVLTTENLEQAWDRLGGAHGHKGIEAADAAIKMMNVIHHL